MLSVPFLLLALNMYMYCKNSKNVFLWVELQIDAKNSNFENSESTL